MESFRKQKFAFIYLGTTQQPHCSWASHSARQPRPRINVVAIYSNNETGDKTCSHLGKKDWASMDAS